MMLFLPIGDIGRCSVSSETLFFLVSYWKVFTQRLGIASLSENVSYLFSMTKKPLLNTLHKPVRPILSLVLILIGLVGFVGIIALALRSNQKPSPSSLQYQAQLPPTATPTPVDTSTWKTYTDWKYGFSIKLPPEFASYIPGKGYTGDTIDPEGTGKVQFEDTTLSGDYPNRTAKYGFYVQFAESTNPDSNCSTDQNCLNSLTNFYKNIPGKMEIRPIQVTILNRPIKGLAVFSGFSAPPPSLYYFYKFTENGKPFSVVVGFYYPKSFQQAQTKDPVINAILASISFANQ